MDRRLFLSNVGVLLVASTLDSCFLGRLNKTLVYFIGDSITYGTGTTGTASIKAVNKIVGKHTYPAQVQLMLPEVDTMVFGYPGLSADKYNSDFKGFLTNHLKRGYKQKIAVIFFGANDVEFYDEEKTFKNIVEIHQAFRAKGVKTIVVPVLNRKDKFVTQPNFDIKRLALNQRLKSNYEIFADGFAHLEDQSNIYSSVAPADQRYFKHNDVEGLSGVHPTDQGAKLIAVEVTKSVQSILNNS